MPPSPKMPAMPDMPPMPAMPTWGSRSEWKEWKRQQRLWEEERRRRERASRRALKKSSGEHEAGLPVSQRISSWRRKTIGGLGTIGGLAMVNVFTSPEFMWFMFPSMFIFIGIVSHAGRLWGDGVPVGQLFRRGTLGPEHANPQLAGSTQRGPDQLALRLASADVLAGSYGESVRRAAADRTAVEETIARLAPSERDMIPDVGPTVVALSERVGSLAQTLHQLDADVSGASVTTLEHRVAELKSMSGPEPTPEQERRIALLERQRATIGELIERRTVLASQLESAALALQNLRLDLLKLRSSGLGSAMSDVTNATQEARAISRDIGHAVDAVREVKRL
jgi:serine/threonine-protein kinase